MKLYWRYKKDGKWTWQSAHVVETKTVDQSENPGHPGYSYVLNKVEEE